MKRGRRRGVAALAIVVACVAACGSVRSAITVRPDGTRTFTVAKAEGGQSIACTAAKVIPDLVAAFHGSLGAAEPAWLEDSAGKHLSVVWPEGFTVTFGPQAQLRNEAGRVIASEGDTVEFGQVALGSHKGTPDDPYIASGLVLGGCYIYSP